ncbi:MAG: maleate cis-trans isomerase, partial [Pseudomonadota bacterium]|nr:maleate cis-trans isomerase [Pseudomonadota bacterium]
ADGLFTSCTNLATMDRNTEMEDRLAKPVVTSNSATLWRALRAANALADIDAGALFQRDDI